MLSRKCGVYLITSPSKGRYVGSSKSLTKRFNRYKNYGCKNQPAILSSLKKYGFENHKVKVLMYCEEKELFFWERVFGDMYLASAEFPNGLNITLPGYGDVPQVRSKEFRQRVSEIQKKRFEDPEERRKVSERTKIALAGKKDLLSSIQKKKFEDPEQRRLMSERRKNYYKKNPDALNKMSEDAKQRFKNNPNLKEKCLSGLRKYYEENPDKKSNGLKVWRQENPNYAKEISEKLKKTYKENPELRKKASEKSKLQFANPENNVRSKKVINIETGEKFSCIRVLAERLGRKAETVSKWIRNNKIPYKYV